MRNIFSVFNPDKMVLGAIIFIVSMTVGLIWKLILDRRKSGYEITWTEYLIGGLIVGLIFALIGVSIAWNIAWNSKVTYHEYWNGWELEAVEIETVCQRDGSCYYEYDCDPYTVLEAYDCNCDEDGHCDTCFRTVTKYHQCPYVTAEYSHVIKTTLGDYQIDTHVFSANPEEWRRGSGFPNQVQAGPSQIWVEAKKRCQAGTPGPVTKRMDYENLLLASDSTILQQYSDQIDEYKEKNLLPDLQYGVQNWYDADKVYFVNYQPENANLWQETVAHLNSALGTELQGDMHLVIVQDSDASINPDVYITTLKAYWQCPEFWGRDSISKNSLIVVLGTNDGKNVTWARATTGMPVGNEAMTTTIRSQIKQVPLDPETIVGRVTGEFYTKTYDDGSQKTKVKGIGETGLLRRIIWGMDDPASSFVRISMSADDMDDVGGGFNYLACEIKPSLKEQIIIITISTLASCGVWIAVALFIGERYDRGW